MFLKVRQKYPTNIPPVPEGRNVLSEGQHDTLRDPQEEWEKPKKTGILLL
jgi:hypothetical protein